ncbi:MAG: hypothetical protein NT062_31310 [Proteobacteria bacterium]|nr:hypothetical protein [Pseudomonadota bacterium]
MTHPRLVARGTKRDLEPAGAAIFAPDVRRARWAVKELARRGLVGRVCVTFTEVFAMLASSEAPRPQILVADFDALHPSELFELQALRQYGWFGSIIAVGRVPPALAASLAIDRVVRPPLYEDLLCEAIDSLGLHAVTMPMPILDA